MDCNCIAFHNYSCQNSLKQVWQQSLCCMTAVNPYSAIHLWSSANKSCSTSEAWINARSSPSHFSLDHQYVISGLKTYMSDKEKFYYEAIIEPEACIIVLLWMHQGEVVSCTWHLKGWRKKLNYRSNDIGEKHNVFQWVRLTSVKVWIDLYTYFLIHCSELLPKYVNNDRTWGESHEKLNSWYLDVENETITYSLSLWCCWEMRSLGLQYLWRHTRTNPTREATKMVARIPMATTTIVSMVALRNMATIS